VQRRDGRSVISGRRVATSATTTGWRRGVPDAEAEDHCAVSWGGSSVEGGTTMTLHSNLQLSFEAMYRQKRRADLVEQVPEVASQDAAYARWERKTSDSDVVEHVQARYREALAVENRAMGRFTAGRKKSQLLKAREMYETLLTEHPDFANAACRLAYIAEVVGDLEQSVQAATRASSIDPDFEIAYFCVGVALKTVGRNDEAAAAYRKAIELNPQFAAARDNLGLILVDKGDFEGALEQFNAILRDFPNARNARDNLELAQKHVTRA
jgi:tetratricopeptide (TPR) repeat protein